jgi:serine/threonine protein kinase
LETFRDQVTGRHPRQPRRAVQDSLGNGVDGRADLYALGVVLFECLAGSPPFGAEDAGELIAMHLTVPPPDLSELCPGVAPALVAVVAKAVGQRSRRPLSDHTSLRADLWRIRDGEREEFELATVAGEAPSERPLVGRAEQIGRLTERWRRAEAGLGGAAIITGPPASGRPGWSGNCWPMSARTAGWYFRAPAPTRTLCWHRCGRRSIDTWST